MDNRLHLTPAFLAIVVANLLPIYGAIVGKLFFFQVIYLYWIEGFILILFNVIRIFLARGTEIREGKLFKTAGTDNVPFTFWRRLRMALGFIVARVGILLFYGVFIFAFIAFQVTGKTHRIDIFKTMAFANEFFNLSLLMFFISNATQLVGGFLVSGQYKRVSPRTYNGIIDGRTILLHVMIVGVVFLHQFLFEGKSYELVGEVVYVSLFMVAKMIGELVSLNNYGGKVALPQTSG